MSYGDVQVTGLNVIFTLIIFQVSNLFFAFNLTFDVVLQHHGDVTSSSFKLKTDRKSIFETGKPHFKKPMMVNDHMIVFVQHDPGEIWWF